MLKRRIMFNGIWNSEISIDAGEVCSSSRIQEN
jgi:hypothetical protein